MTDTKSWSAGRSPVAMTLTSVLPLSAQGPTVVGNSWGAPGSAGAPIEETQLLVPALPQPKFLISDSATQHVDQFLPLLRLPISLL